MWFGSVLSALLCSVLLCARVHAGAVTDSAHLPLQQLPPHYLDQVDKKADQLNTAISKKTTQYLQHLSRLEARLLGKLHSVDTSAGAHLPPGQYQRYAAAMQQTAAGAAGPGSTYVPGLDTLSTTLRFLQGQAGVPGVPAVSSGSLGQVSGDVQQLQGKLDETTLIQQYVSQRKQELAQLIAGYTHLPPGVTQAFANYKAETYYYRQQLEQCKAVLNDPDKAEREAVTLLNKVPAYQAFMAQHSLLASLFQLPAAYGSGASLQGLQTRDQVQQLLQQQVGGGGGQAVQGQLQAAQSQMTNMQNSLSKYGAGGQDLDMPDFKPNTQKTKTFLKRLEYGANLQFAKSAYSFPATANVGLTIGYKINDKSTIGLGLAYTAGMGSDWSHIAFSSQGLGLRSFMDWKIKKTWYVTGGYELNYMTQFGSITQLRDRSSWQPSALIGIEKKYHISQKVQGNIQLLYDALYKQEIPSGQMIKLRVGYNF